MTTVISRRYKRAILICVVALLGFLLITDLLLVSVLRERLYQSDHTDTHNELRLIALFLREPLLSGTYDEVEQFLVQWGVEHPDVISFEAVMPNGFVLASYTSPEAGRSSYSLTEEVTYLGNALMTLSVTKEFSHLTLLRSLQYQLVTASILLITSLGIVLWAIMKRFALIPIEREVVVRLNTEKNLSYEKETLEGLVLKRTFDLEEINRDLLHEIEGRKKLESELTKRVKELQSFYDVAVNREMNTTELKAEIKELRKELARLKKNPVP